MAGYSHGVSGFRLNAYCSQNNIKDEYVRIQS